MTHLFIHIPKCAGMTIRHGLKGRIVVAGEGMHKTPEYTDAVRQKMADDEEHHGFEHARWRDVRTDLRILKTFAIVRNPWARTASRYLFARHVLRTGGTHGRGYEKTASSFDAFLEERHEWGGEPYYWHRAVRGWYPQTDYVTDEEGNIRCDVLRCEKLDLDLYAYMGVEEMRSRNVTVKDSPLPWQYLYEDRRRIQIVADWYAKDIETFGFDFDKPATKNYWKPHE